MDSEQVKGKLEQATGKVKEGVGRITGDTRTEAEGQNDQVEGKIRETVGNVRNQMDRDNPVERVADRLDDAKNRAGRALDEETPR